MNVDSSDEMMQATYRALCKHGIADLTMQRIADESSLSTAAFHYHFDTKAELLNEFLDHLVDRFDERLACETDDPSQRLGRLLDAIFGPAEKADTDFPIALFEIKARAPYQPTYRERLVEMDRQLRKVVANTVRDGIEASQFDDADPEIIARFVATAINGAHSRQVALDENPAETRRIVEDYLKHQLGWTPEVPA